jgi:hypothetical protein
MVRKSISRGSCLKGVFAEIESAPYCTDYKTVLRVLGKAYAEVSEKIKKTVYKVKILILSKSTFKKLINSHLP